eukprot:scaffold4428_cov112-Isochrysis_galbana.AAC.2
MEVRENEAVEVREVVVDPLLPSLDVGGEVAWQPLQRINVARCAARISGYIAGSPIALHVSDSYRPIVC